MKYMGKAIDTFGMLKFQPPLKQKFETKTCAVGRASKIELLMLVLYLMMISRLKILNGISMECLNEDVKKKNTLFVHWG